MKTWKQSKDPKFREKVKRLRALMNREHNPPVVVAVDEMGPISLKPYGGRTWARSGHPDRVRATYKRTMGVRHLMGMYDYFHKVLRGYFSPRKSGANWVRFLRYVRRWYPPDERIYLIQDNLSTHTTPEALREARRLKISLVPIPTNSSHMNPIETHFRSIRQMALTGSDFREWRPLGAAIQMAMRELNAKHSAPAHKVKRCLWVRHSRRPTSNCFTPFVVTNATPWPGGATALRGRPTEAGAEGPLPRHPIQLTRDQPR